MNRYEKPHSPFALDTHDTIVLHEAFGQKDLSLLRGPIPCPHSAKVDLFDQ